jgi:two-component system chemotaxis sensor kinase CheA
MLSPVLKAAGYRVVTAGSAEEALNILASNLRIDVLITDVEMPGRDGFALVEAMRASGRNADLPVIALAAGVTPDLVDRARRLQIGDFVAKFDRSGLVAALAETQPALGEAA